MKRKGFTLIELLTVIVVLAIIALIATPIIIKRIEKARKGAFEDSAYGVMNAAKLYFAEASFDGKVERETFTFPEDTKLKLSGKKPKSGSVRIDETGKIEMAISNGVWCALKNIDEEKVRVIDYSIDECEIGLIPSTDASCFIVKESTGTITSYKCDDTNVVIPRTINGKKIISIGMGAFSNRNLTSVVIPDTVTLIESAAFQWNKLTSVTLSKNLTRIGPNAFYSNQLSLVEFPETLETIDDSAFTSNHLTVVNIPSNVTKIGNEAFAYNQLASVNMSNGLKTIGKKAFLSNQLTNIQIPESVNSIGAAAFNINIFPITEAFIYGRNSDGTENRNKLISYAGSEKNIIIPSAVTTIGESAFETSSLKAIQQVTFPNGLISIGLRAFYRNNLSSIVLPDTVTTIGESAFSGNKITTLELGSGVTNIGSSAFSSNKLTSVSIPSTIATIEAGAFSYNDSEMKITVNKIKDSITGSPWGAASVEWIG